jgi:formylglycine-generating enzyme required for sulfatase activity/transcriptional regulator with XRE-family HTH domain
MRIQIGEFIRDRRLRAGLSQSELATRLDLADDGHVAAVERGEELPTQAFLRRVVEALRLGQSDRVQLWEALTAAEEEDRETQGPYRGLSAFREQDRRLYYGRQPITALLRAKVEHSPVVSVVGASGSGKSSLVFAGVVPSLREHEEWLVCSMRPGSRPFDSLAVTLLPILEPELRSVDIPAHARALGEELAKGGAYAAFESVLGSGTHGRKVLLIVDQFEELYTQCSDSTLARAFVDSILETAQAHGSDDSVHCLLTLRGDFYGHVVGYAPLSEALQDNVVNLPPMSVSDLRSAIQEPALLYGGTFEDGLVDRIVSDAGTEPGVLPLVEYCLTLLWRRTAGGYLTHKAYEEAGGLQGSIATQAENVYKGQSEPRRVTVRRVFTRLVKVASFGEEGTDARRRAALAEFQHLPGSAGVLAALVNARLLCSDYDRGLGSETIEIAHEAVIRRWARLTSWLVEDREFLLWQEQVRSMRKQWEDSRREESLTLRGRSLAQAEDWVTQRSDEVDHAVRQFVDLSVETEAREAGTRALEQADFLLTAQPDEVPRLIELMRPQSRWVNPRLREMLEEHAATAGYGWRLRLALVDSDPALLRRLGKDLLDLSPHDFAVLCLALCPFAEQLREDLWATALSYDASAKRRFRAACALAQYDPANADWRQISGIAVRCLAAENPLHIRDWLRVLWPVRDGLVDGLRDVLKSDDERDAVRETVALILAQFLADDPTRLARLVTETTSPAYESVLRVLLDQEGSRDEAARELSSIVSEKPIGTVTESARRQLGRRRAVAAISLIRMTRTEEISSLFEPADDIEASTQFCHQCRERGVHASAVADMILAAKTSSQRYSLVLALGEFLKDELTNHQVERMTAHLRHWYSADPDPGVHAAVGWLLLRWGFGEHVLAVDEETIAVGDIHDMGERAWCTISAAGSIFPFVILRPGAFVMGSPEYEAFRKSDESPQHLVRMSRRLAVCAREITRAEYELFDAMKGLDPLPDISDWSPALDCPVVGITWFEALAFSDWLSREFGVPVGSHNANADRTTLDAAASGVRLLTEAEWEWACRAGSVAAFSFGGDESYLDRYGWFDANSGYRTHPWRELRPNRFGLFSMHGNCWEWCSDWYGPYGAETDEDPTGGPTSSWRVLRGGCWNLNARYARSARRVRHVPTNRNWYDGIRVCFSI